METTERTFTVQEAVELFSKRKLVTAPGKYKCRVMNDVKALADSGKVHREVSNSRAQISIVNVDLVTPYMKEQFIALAKAGETQDAINQNVTCSVLDNFYMPVRGEMIEVFMDWVITKSGERALLATGYKEIEAVEANSISSESLLAEFEISDDRVPIVDNEAQEEEFNQQAQTQPQAQQEPAFNKKKAPF